MTATTISNDTILQGTYPACAKEELVVDEDETETTVTDEEEFSCSSSSSSDDDETIVASADMYDNHTDPSIPKTPPVERIISFGIPSVPITTIAILKGNEEEKEDDTPSSTNDTESTSRSVSFNEEVTMNHVDNFRYVLKKRERCAIWYTDIEMNRMFVDGHDVSKAYERKEKIQENKQIVLSNTAAVVDRVPTTNSNTVPKTTNTSPTRKRRLSLKKAKSVSNFLKRTTKQRLRRWSW